MPALDFDGRTLRPLLAGATAWSSQGAWNMAGENNGNISLEGRWRAVSDATAVDGAFARWDSPLRDGCEIAFIPPVSGG